LEFAYRFKELCGRENYGGCRFTDRRIARLKAFMVRTGMPGTLSVPSVMQLNGRDILPKRTSGLTNGELMRYSEILKHIDQSSGDIPFTHTQACHLLFHLAVSFVRPQIVEVACGYGKATLYLAVAAKAKQGHLWTVDVAAPRWNGRNAEELIRRHTLQNYCDIMLDQDARWFLLDVFKKRPNYWIDLAYVDASHTVEDDSFVALALWTHLRPGGLLVFDDLDWIPSVHGEVKRVYSRPMISHARVLYEHISSLPDAIDCVQWGRDVVGWTWGIVQKKATVQPYSTPKLFRLLKECTKA
jgi:predicted O-methyltransferase YrrM